MKNKMPH